MSTQIPEPLVSATDIEDHDSPIVQIDKGKRDALSLCGHKRAKNSPGTIRCHERGILGEYAVAKYLGIPDRVDTNIYEFGDSGYDFEYRGDTIDVKTVGPKENNPELRVNSRKPPIADYYVLAQQLNLSTYQIIGYAHRQAVCNARTRLMRLDGYCKRVFALPQDQLYPL